MALRSFSSVDVLMRSPSLPYKASSQAARNSSLEGKGRASLRRQRSMVR